MKIRSPDDGPQIVLFEKELPKKAFLNRSGFICQLNGQMLCNHLIAQGIGMHTVGEPVLMILRQFVQIDDLEGQILRLSPDTRRNAAVYCFCADIEADLSGFGIGIALRRVITMTRG